MLRIGLTGGIGAGKSTVARLLTDLGAELVDHDLLAREVVAPGTPGLAEIEDAFGPEVIGANGALDRQALGAKVFEDSAARARLEAIIHPRVRELAAVREDEARRRGVPAVVHDIPLLAETRAANDFDRVIVVSAPLALRFERLAADRAMSREEAHARIAAQATDAQREAIATTVIVNDADLGSLRAKVDDWWRSNVA